MVRWTLENYQRGGIVDTKGIGRSNIKALAKYIAEKADMPDLRIQITPGDYAHKQGLAADFQPGGGSGNPEAMERLKEVILGIDWDFWGIRYAAGSRMEYGGSWGGKERARPQTAPYGGTTGGQDGWHDRHWHVDVYANAPTRDIQAGVPATNPTPPPSPAPTPSPTPTPTPPEEDEMALKAILFTSVDNANRTNQYFAYPASRTYEYVKDTRDREDRQNVAKKMGFEVETWKNTSGNSNVGNPNAFGSYIGPIAFKPKGAL